MNNQGDDDNADQSEYTGLRFARDTLQGITYLIYGIGALSVVGGVMAGIVAMEEARRQTFPSSFSPYVLVAAVAFVVLGIVIVVVGWNVSIAAERLGMEIETISRIRQLVHFANKTIDVQQAMAGKFDLQLRAISASTSRTAEAVEALAATVRRPPPAA